MERETNQEKIAAPLLSKNSNSKFTSPLWICSFFEELKRYRRFGKCIQKMFSHGQNPIYSWSSVNLLHPFSMQWEDIAFTSDMSNGKSYIFLKWSLFSHRLSIFKSICPIVFLRINSYLLCFEVVLCISQVIFWLQVVTYVQLCINLCRKLMYKLIDDFFIDTT